MKLAYWISWEDALETDIPRMLGAAFQDPARRRILVAVVPFNYVLLYGRRLWWRLKRGAPMNDREQAEYLKAEILHVRQENARLTLQNRQMQSLITRIEELTEADE